MTLAAAHDLWMLYLGLSLVVLAAILYGVGALIARIARRDAR